MLRDNERHEVTMQILRMVEDGRESPKPQYKYEQIKVKFKERMKEKKRMMELTKKRIASLFNKPGQPSAEKENSIEDDKNPLVTTLDNRSSKNSLKSDSDCFASDDNNSE